MTRTAKQWFKDALEGHPVPAEAYMEVYTARANLEAQLKAANKLVEEKCAEGARIFTRLNESVEAHNATAAELESIRDGKEFWLTPRDKFAMAALASLSPRDANDSNAEPDVAMAHFAYKVADAMMIWREVKA